MAGGMADVQDPSGGQAGAARASLYPALEPYMSGRLPVGDGHELYFEQCGNPEGEPVLVVHGGPGGGSSPLMRRYHDPSRYRIVLYDQRGCGRSTPHASLDDNTTWHLVADIERLRRHLGIERWQLFGGSWGSTLSLIYAIECPERVTSMVLRGIFLLRQREIDWFYQEGCSWIFPEAFAEFVAQIPEAERGNLVAAYYRRLTNPDLAVQLAAAKAWSVWEGSTLSLQASPARLRAFASDHYARAFARIECHYFVNRGFFSREDHIIESIDRIRHIPATIVHGRFDVVTPVRNAWDLKQAWPEAELIVVPSSGHAMSEPNIISELVGATRRALALIARP